jgi:flagellar assembly protein FliH
MSDTQSPRLEIGAVCSVSSGFRPLNLSENSVSSDANSLVDRYQLGFEDGSAVAAEVFEEERTRLIDLLRACEALQNEPSDELAVLIAETVRKLVTDIVGETPVSAERLLARAERAAAVIADVDGERTLHLHPDDLAMVVNAGLPVTLLADQNLARGSVRGGCSTGWIEDGTSAHLSDLYAALDLK